MPRFTVTEISYIDRQSKSVTFSVLCCEITQKHCSLLSERKELVKFKIDNHKLTTETGRYDQIPDYTLFVHVNLIK